MCSTPYPIGEIINSPGRVSASHEHGRWPSSSLGNQLKLITQMVVFAMCSIKSHSRNCIAGQLQRTPYRLLNQSVKYRSSRRTRSAFVFLRSDSTLQDIYRFFSRRKETALSQAQHLACWSHSCRTKSIILNLGIQSEGYLRNGRPPSCGSKLLKPGMDYVRMR